MISGELTLDVIQAEAVLHVRLGDASVMAEQLHATAELAELPNVTVRIMHFDAGQHAIRGLDTFTIMEHPWGSPSVFVESYGGGRFISDADEVAYFVEAFEQGDEAGALAGRVGRLHPEDRERLGEAMTTQWRKSSRSNNGQCVEVATLPGVVAVRDSKLGDHSPVLTVNPDQWREFLAGLGR